MLSRKPLKKRTTSSETESTVGGTQDLHTVGTEIGCPQGGAMLPRGVRLQLSYFFTVARRRRSQLARCPGGKVGFGGHLHPFAMRCVSVFFHTNNHFISIIML